jgi:hypothetical protein
LYDQNGGPVKATLKKIGYFFSLMTGFRPIHIFIAEIWTSPYPLPEAILSAGGMEDMLADSTSRQACKYLRQLVQYFTRERR